MVEGFPNAFQRQALWLFAHALAAPILRFSEGARRLGVDPRAPALEREGPVEMLNAIDSFNAMQGRITRLSFRLDGLEQPLKDKVEANIDEMKLMITGGESTLLEGDPLSLRRLVVNLVDIALKYGDRARLRLHTGAGVRSIEIDDDGARDNSPPWSKYRAL